VNDQRNQSHVENATPNIERRINRDELTESLVIGVAALALYIITYTFDEVPVALSMGITPQLFPRIVLLTIMFLCILMGTRAFRAVGGAKKSLKTPPKIAFITGGMLILFVVGLYTVGAIISVLAFCLGLSLIWGERRYIPMLITFGLFTGGIYLLFEVILGANLP
jgi:uncharacterized membrane protein